MNSQIRELQEKNTELVTKDRQSKEQLNEATSKLKLCDGEISFLKSQINQMLVNLEVEKQRNEAASKEMLALQTKLETQKGYLSISLFFLVFWAAQT